MTNKEQKILQLVSIINYSVFTDLLLLYTDHALKNRKKKQLDKLDKFITEVDQTLSEQQRNDIMKAIVSSMQKKMALWQEQMRKELTEEEYIQVVAEISEHIEKFREDPVHLDGLLRQFLNR